MQKIAWVTGLLIVLTPGLAHAYTGPSLGMGALIAILAVIGTGLLAVLAIFWYPLKRMRRRRKQAKAGTTADAQQPEDG